MKENAEGGRFNVFSVQMKRGIAGFRRICLFFLSIVVGRLYRMKRESFQCFTTKLLSMHSKKAVLASFLCSLWFWMVLDELLPMTMMSVYVCTTCCLPRVLFGSMAMNIILALRRMHS